MIIYRKLIRVDGDFWKLVGHVKFDEMLLSRGFKYGTVDGIAGLYHDCIEHSSPSDESYAGELQALGAYLFFRYRYTIDHSFMQNIYKTGGVFRADLEDTAAYFKDSPIPSTRSPRMDDWAEELATIAGASGRVLQQLRKGWARQIKLFGNTKPHQVRKLYKALESAVFDAMTYSANELFIKIDTTNLECKVHV